ncbi:hypothetical protein PybrP1_001923 [[Pythium] brassicae (nom. inval.)]|nr:hypothetical protein PybrP1_001923 [[Pythium] brassicae (nom. inval.)]
MHALARWRAHQHFVVPYAFRVPGAAPPVVGADPLPSAAASAGEWPPHTHGLNLGRALRSFLRGVQRAKGGGSAAQRATLAELDALGFPLVPDWSRFQWEQVALRALREFKRVHGHLRVPRRFVVPAGDAAWPRAAWGYKLGAHVNQLRARTARLPRYQREALERVGFAWQAVRDTWTQRFLPALRQFRALHGHVNVPQAFVVPVADPAWPHERLYGFQLGRMVNRVRSGDAYLAQVARFRPELDALGFSFSVVEATWDEKLLPALEAFRAVHGHCNVGTSFVVPHEAPWPRTAWGCKLGYIVRNIRSRGDYFDLVGRDMDRLDALGFVWNPLEVRWRQRVFPALETFVRVHGHAAIERGFVVPARTPWPERTWGLDLGRVASDPGFHAKYADFISIERGPLEALGFFWSAAADDDDDDDDDDRDSDDDFEESDDNVEEESDDDDDDDDK